jgi:anaerobic dimethyl sulfoxide reductase subunit B (iron-sulfur subunit)
MDHGLLIDYLYCTGCHSCEVSCQVEHGFDPGVSGIALKQQGPEQIAGRRWQYDFLPMPTERCDLCAARIRAGKQPSCVQHCQAGCMSYGRVADLAQRMTHKKMVLYR